MVDSNNNNNKPLQIIFLSSFFYGLFFPSLSLSLKGPVLLEGVRRDAAMVWGKSGQSSPPRLVVLFTPPLSPGQGGKGGVGERDSKEIITYPFICIDVTLIYLISLRDFSLNLTSGQW